MINLTQTTDKIQVSLAGSVTANQLQCFASWRTMTSTTHVRGRNAVNTNSTTDVDLVTAPGSGEVITVEFLSVYNKDTANATVTIKLDADGTEYILWKGTLLSGESLQYAEGSGFISVDTFGRLKSSTVNNVNAPVINTLNMVVLSGDVINNNAVANTIANVTGLSFDVIAAQTYWFEFTIPYTSAATATGSRWSITGPAAPTRLNMRSEYTLAATTTTNGSITAYDMPAGCNTTSLINGNIATMWGIIVPSQNGTVIARFASEVANSAITAKAGATLRWMRVI